MELINILKQKRNVYYIENVNINYSFSSLLNICHQSKIDLESGDVLIVDNQKKDRRKMYFLNGNGAIIIYGLLKRNNQFLPFETNKQNKIILDKSFKEKND